MKINKWIIFAILFGLLLATNMPSASEEAEEVQAAEASQDEQPEAVEKDQEGVLEPEAEVVQEAVPEPVKPEVPVTAKNPKGSKAGKVEKDPAAPRNSATPSNGAKETKAKKNADSQTGTASSTAGADKKKTPTTKRSTKKVEVEEVPDVDADKEDDQLAIMEEWEKVMHDFVPDEILTFTLKERQQELLFEEITQPTTIRGAFFSSYTSMEKVDFLIRSPSQKRIFERFNKREVIFNLNVTEIGTYEFIFSNFKGKETKDITFALDVHNITDSHLQSSDLDPVEKKLEIIATGIRDFLSEARFSSKKQRTQLESLEAAHYRLLGFSIGEIVIVLAVTAWQVYYIKRILENKRIV